MCVLPGIENVCEHEVNYCLITGSLFKNHMYTYIVKS